MRTKILMTVAGLIWAGLLAVAPVASADHPSGVVESGPGVAKAAPEPAKLAGGAVTIGEAATGIASCFFMSPYGMTLETEDPARPSYVAPFSGVLTSYSTLPNATPGNIRALVIKAGADATHKVLVAKSEQHVSIPSVLNTVPVRLPIKAGERLALGLSATGMNCAVLTSAADTSRFAENFNADTSTDFAYTNVPFATVRPNISAVLEPDVDSDGYGDVSQDHCPALASEQLPCPAPDSIVTQKPKKTSTKRKVTIAFTAGVPGATFTCAVDGKAAVPCLSPFKMRFKYGKHTVVITARSAVGIPDASPALVRFKVKKPKR